MADFPYLPLFTDAYLADTRHLSRNEHGAYLLLMMEAWRRPRCSLPDNDTFLARVTCSTEHEWAAIKPAVMAFWTLDKRRREWTQKRLAKERTYVEAKRRSNRHNAAKRWQKTERPDATAMPNACQKHANPQPTTHTHIRKKETPSESPKKDGRRGSRLPYDHLPASWSDWAVSQCGIGVEDAEVIWDTFRDYWIAQPGQRGVKLDWPATWRNWCRREGRNTRPQSRPSGAGTIVTLPTGQQTYRSRTGMMLKELAQKGWMNEDEG